MAEANYSIKATIEANAKKFKSAIQAAKNSAERFKSTMEKIKDNEIDADSSGVKRAVESAKSAMESFNNTKAEGNLDVDIDEVKSKVAIAEEYVRKFDAYRGDAELDANVTSAKANIEEAQAYLERFDGSTANAHADVDARRAITTLSKLQIDLDMFDGNSYSAHLDADATKARVAIAEAKKSLNSFARQKAKATVEVNEGAAVSKILALKAMLRSIPNRIHTRIDVDSDKAQGAFRAMVAGIDSSMNSWDALATRIRTIGTVISNMIQGSLISNITLVIPIIASMVPALFAVLNAIGVVAGGAAGLAAAFGVAAGGVMGFGVMAASAIKMLNDGTLQATAATQRYQSALDGLKSSWEGIIKQNQSQIFNTMANSLNTMKVALAGLSPFISGVSKGMEQASAKMLDWAKNSQVAKQFFEVMGTTGVRVFNNMLSAAGNFGSGVISVLTQLAPLADWAAAGFKRMGQAFNSWAQSSAGQEAIKSFIEYTKQNLPLIGQIFANTFKGIFNLMKAFAPNTHSILESLAQMSEKFASWSATVAKSDGFKKFMEYVNTCLLYTSPSPRD